MKEKSLKLPSFKKKLEEWFEKYRSSIGFALFFIGIALLLFWVIIYSSEDYLDFAHPQLVPQYSASGRNIKSGDTVPDFKMWKIKKEGEVDANYDGKNDFKLRYYLKDQEDAVAVFVPLENRPPKLLIYAHYPNKNLDIFLAEFYIGFGVFSGGKWILANPIQEDKYTKAVREELRNLKINMTEKDIIERIVKTNFNIRRGKADKKKDGESFTL